MPRQGVGVTICLVLMALPLLIPWNVVGAMWNIFALPDIGLLGKMLNGVGFDYNFTQNTFLGLGDRSCYGRLALDFTSCATLLCGVEIDSRRLLSSLQN